MAEQTPSRQTPRPAPRPDPKPDDAAHVRPVEAPRPEGTVSNPDPDKVSDRDQDRETPDVARPVAENSEHTLEQKMALSDEELPDRCQCDNARCTGHYRKNYCTGLASHAVVLTNRPDDPMRVMCDTCFEHTMTYASDQWTEVEGGMEKYRAAQAMHVDPLEEARRAARLIEAERAARTEMAPEANPGLRIDQQRPNDMDRDVRVPVLDDSYQTTSQIPVLDPPKDDDKDDKDEKNKV